MGEVNFPGTFKMKSTTHKKPRIRNHEDEVKGCLVAPPVLGEGLRFTGPALEKDAGTRVIHTSDVEAIVWEPEGFEAKTFYSVYTFKLDKPEDVEALKAAAEASASDALLDEAMGETTH